MQKYTLTLYIAAPGTSKTKGAPSIQAMSITQLVMGKNHKVGVLRLLDSPMFQLQVSLKMMNLIFIRILTISARWKLLKNSTRR